jgi:hypothetical protein
MIYISNFLTSTAAAFMLIVDYYRHKGPNWTLSLYTQRHTYRIQTLFMGLFFMKKNPSNQNAILFSFKPTTRTLHQSGKEAL